MEKICDFNKCTGCGACVNVCPKNCIEMRLEEDAFYHPHIDQSKCIDCGLCAKTCPANKQIIDDKKEPLAYAAYSKNEEARLRSASGGVFYELAKNVIEKNGIVVGAGYDDKFNVVHKICSSIDELKELQGSKYSQSNTGYIYKEVRKYLIKDKDRLVLFSGTPCQIAALVSFLGKEYPNLILVDFICHAIPSPSMWQKYLEYREKEYDGKVTSVEFRNKTKGWDTSGMKICFSNGKIYFSENRNDPYFRSFINHMFVRESCGVCQFKQTHRQSDITLADFWGINKVAPELYDDKGTSLIMVHSSKGKYFLDMIQDKLVLVEVSFNDSIKYNPSYFSALKPHPVQKKFIKEVNKKNFMVAYNKYNRDTFLSKLRRFLAKKGL